MFQNITIFYENHMKVRNVLNFSNHSRVVHGDGSIMVDEHCQKMSSSSVEKLEFLVVLKNIQCSQVKE